ncbi:hypothetical protein CALCODRAFT_261205 [Calocera cornea HHB12733]|uniref:BAH domain-containing protein n=1 Tax=Calocera cornea HHB12733 TaxID=1353952 RepID=A0A165GJ26_9BASI|nr:hypothetical protein CALCODRAFT_261205 [Calocera cornea HHB12733]
MGGKRRRAREVGDPEAGIRCNLPALDYVPSLKEALGYEEARCLNVRSDGKLIMQLKAGDDILIVPSDPDLPIFIDELLLWKARISRIVKEPGTEQRWLIVQWYYSPADFQKLKAPDSGEKDFGERELIFSTSMDVISWETVEAGASITVFNEEDWDCEDIPENGFYCRGVWDDVKRRWLKKRPAATCVSIAAQPKVSQVLTYRQICRRRYKLHEDGLMYYCARPGCCKWYHDGCLERSKAVESSLMEIELELNWEMSLDLDDKHCDLADSIPHAPLRPRSKGRAPDPYSFIPTELLELARQPIIRGGAYGTTGNAAVLLRARVIVDRVARHGEELLEDWTEHVWQKETPATASLSTADHEANDKSMHVDRGRDEHLIRSTKKIERQPIPEFAHRVNEKGWEIAYKCPGCGKVI